MCGEPPAPSRRAGELSGDGKHRWFCLAYFAPNRCRDQLPKRPVVQSHGITLSFHREMADASRELVGPDVTAAVSFESYHLDGALSRRQRRLTVRAISPSMTGFLFKRRELRSTQLRGRLQHPMPTQRLGTTSLAAWLNRREAWDV